VGSKKHLVLYLIIFTLIGFIVIGTFILSYEVENWNTIGDSVARLSMIFYPLFIYCVALAMKELNEKK
jgi:hypothetical protein